MQVTKGMRDFYPEEFKLREWLFDKFRGAALRSGFQFYEYRFQNSALTGFHIEKRDTNRVWRRVLERDFFLPINIVSID